LEVALTDSRSSPRVRELLDLAGRVALVTGASRNIGAGIARRLAEAGAAVIVHWRSREDGAAEVVESIVAAGGRAHALQADLAEPGDVDGLISRTLEVFGTLDIAINNAGSFPVRPLLEMTFAEWQAMYADNVESAFLCTQGAARHMRRAGGGAIVNVASIESLTPAPDHSHYGSAKAAVVMFTRAAAQELGPYGIRVNAVSPGLVARPGIAEDWPDGVQRWLKQVPLGRLGEAEDVADACLFLASPAARFISGHNLVVDGGMLSAKIY
jgi:NAD(P)-dependent dehydrogenase (short-subunit alcohol dehydrogenase family)